MWTEDDWSQLNFRLLRHRRIPIDAGWGGDAIRWWFWRVYRFETRGAGVTLADGRRLSFRPGRWYLFPPGLEFSRHCQRPMRHNYAHFSVTGLPETLWTECFPVPAEGSAPWPAQPLDSAAALADAIGIFGHALDGLSGQNRQRLRRALAAPEPLARARRRAEETAGAVTVPELATLAAWTPDHFSRCFKAAYRIGPAAYLQRLRVQAATRALLFTDHSLEHIAETCGFRDRAYLTRVFTAHIGQSPAAFRKLHRHHGQPNERP